MGVHPGGGKSRPLRPYKPSSPWRRRPRGSQGRTGPEPQAGELDLGQELDVHQDDEYLLS